MLAMYDGILACGDEESEAEGDGELAGGEDVKGVDHLVGLRLV